MASKTLGNGSARARPSAAPMAAIFMPSKNHAQHVRSFGSERHADGDFVRALSDGVGNETIDSDSGG